MSWYAGELDSLKRKYIANKDYITTFGKMIDKFLKKYKISGRKMDKTFMFNLSINVRQDIHADITTSCSTAFNQHYYGEWYYKIFRDLLRTFNGSDFPTFESPNDTNSYLTLSTKAIEEFIVSEILKEEIPSLVEFDHANEVMNCHDHRDKDWLLSHNGFDFDEINPETSEFKSYSRFYFQKELLNIMVDLGIFTKEEIIESYFSYDGYHIKAEFNKIFASASKVIELSDPDIVNFVDGGFDYREELKALEKQKIQASDEIIQPFLKKGSDALFSVLIIPSEESDQLQKINQEFEDQRLNLEYKRLLREQKDKLIEQLSLRHDAQSILMKYIESKNWCNKDEEDCVSALYPIMCFAEKQNDTLFMDTYNSMYDEKEVELTKIKYYK